MFNCTRFAEVQHSLLEAKLVASAATTFVLTTAVQPAKAIELPTWIGIVDHGPQEREGERERESERE